MASEIVSNDAAIEAMEAVDSIADTSSQDDAPGAGPSPVVDAPLWNRVHVTPPPELWLTYTWRQYAAIAALGQHAPAAAATGAVDGLHRLRHELHLLRSIAYRVGNQFSNLAAFSALRQLIAAGRRLRHLPGPDWLRGRAAALLQPPAGAQLQLPSQQAAHHLLLVCWQLAALLLRLAQLAECAARGWLRWLRIGHHAALAVSFVAMAGRVWDLSRATAARLCALYAQLRPVAAALRPAVGSWPHPQLPACLRRQLQLPDDVSEQTAAALVTPGRSRPRQHQLQFRDQPRTLDVSLLSEAGRHSLQRVLRCGDGAAQVASGGSQAATAAAADAERDMQLAVALGQTEDIGVSMEGDGGAPVDDDTAASADRVTVPMCGTVAVARCAESDDENVAVDGTSALYNAATAPSAQVAVDDHDRDLYRRLQRVTRGWKLPKHVAEFIKSENAARKQCRSGCVTSRLKNNQWKQLKAELNLGKVAWRTSRQSGAEQAAEKAKKRLKMCLKLWSLFPELHGKKPVHWSTFLQEVKR